jgi:hypothetical protein
VLWTVVTSSVRGRADIRPLKLVDPPPLQPGRPGAAVRRPVNITGSPVHGVGSLGLAIFGVLLSTAAPALWWLPLAGAGAGLVLGLALVLVHRRRGLWTSPRQHALALSVQG